MRHLVLSGTPKERGLLHGRTWSAEIHELANIRKALLLGALKHWSKEEFSSLVTKHLEVLQEEIELWEEFCGISEGAQISLEDLMILNNHTDLRDFGYFSDIESINECSCIAIKSDKGVIAGQTWDMHGSAKDYVAHLSLQKDNNVQEEIFTLTGCLGLTGISNQGIGVFINNLRSKKLQIGLMWPALVRKILNQKSIPEATETIKNNIPSGGRNFFISTEDNATNVEVSGTQISCVGDLSQNHCFHTNHYLSELKKDEEESTRSQTTFKRYDFLKDFFDLKPLQRPHSALAFANELFSQAPKISIAYDPAKPHASASCGGLFYDFALKEGFSFSGEHKDKDFLAFSLKK